MTDSARVGCLARPFVVTVALNGLKGWVYVAFVAVLDPRLLSYPLNESLAIRKDTFGALCFMTSAIAYFVAQILCHHDQDQRDAALPAQARVPDSASVFLGALRLAPHLYRGSTLVALLRTGFFYATLGWAYIAMNSVSHPWTLSLPLTHLASWPREGAFGAACFVASLLCYLTLQLLVTSRRIGNEPSTDRP